MIDSIPSDNEARSENDYVACDERALNRGGRVWEPAGRKATATSRLR